MVLGDIDTVFKLVANGDVFDQFSNQHLDARLIHPLDVLSRWAVLHRRAHGVAEAEEAVTECLAAIENEVLMPEVTYAVAARCPGHTATVLKVFGNLGNGFTTLTGVMLERSALVYDKATELAPEFLAVDLEQVFDAVHIDDVGVGLGVE